MDNNKCSQREIHLPNIPLNAMFHEAAELFSDIDTPGNMFKGTFA